MIYTTLNGRCGNQLFQYAFARRLQIDYGDQMTFCDGLILGRQQTDPSFANELDLFDLADYETEHTSRAILRHGNAAQILICYIYRLVCRLPYKKRVDFYHRQERWQPILNRFGIYELIRGYSPVAYTRFKNKFINGYYEDERWFDDVRESLLKEIQVKYPNHNNDELYHAIVSHESVCVSIRRGDFLEEKHKAARAICGEDYFRQAIAVMKAKKPEAIYVFFSDDIDWVRKHYDFGVESYYETGVDSVGEKLRLMSACKHFILSNSTFSWWAQYLSASEDKIVISPDHWFNMPGYRHSLISEDWTLVRCD